MKVRSYAEIPDDKGETKQIRGRLNDAASILKALDRGEGHPEVAAHAAGWRTAEALGLLLRRLPAHLRERVYAHLRLAARGFKP